MLLLRAAVHDTVPGILRGWGHVRVREQSVDGVEDVLNCPLLLREGDRGSPESDIASIYRKTSRYRDIEQRLIGGQVPSSPN